MPSQSRSQSHCKLAAVVLLCCTLISGVSSTPTRVTRNNFNVDSGKKSGVHGLIGRDYDFPVGGGGDGVHLSHAVPKNKRALKQFKIRRGYSSRFSRGGDTDSGDNGNDNWGNDGGYEDGADSGYGGSDGDGDGGYDGGYGGGYGYDHDHDHKSIRPRPSPSLTYRG